MVDQRIDIADQPNIASEGALGNEFFIFVKIMAMLEMVANGLGKLEFAVVTMAVQGGFMFMLQRKDFVFISVTLLFEGIRIFCSSPEHNMQQSAPFYWFQLVSAITTGVLSAMQLSLQDFGQAEESYKVNRDFALNFFYVIALLDAMLLLVWCYFLKKPLD